MPKIQSKSYISRNPESSEQFNKAESECARAMNKLYMDLSDAVPQPPPKPGKVDMNFQKNPERLPAWTFY